MSQHLTGAWWIRTHGSPLLPTAAIGGDLIRSGYPLGPHGIVAALTAGTGAGEVKSFSALTMLVPIVGALAALGALPKAAPRAGRFIAAAMVGLCYLTVAYYAQGQFKEILQGALVLGTGVMLADIIDPEQRPSGLLRTFLLGVPLGVLTAGAIYNFSYNGAAWEVGAVGVLAVLMLLRRPRDFVGLVRATALSFVGAAIAMLVLISPEKDRMRAFSNSIFGAEPKTNTGNLPHPINPFETVGAWFSGDFRIVTHPLWPTILAEALLTLALLGGLVWWWRRSRLAVPATVIATAIIWANLAISRNIYNAAKGLAVLAPVLMLCIAAPLLAAWVTRRAGDGPVTGRLRAVRVLGVVLLACTAFSSLLALRSTVVGIGPAEAQLAAVRPIVGHDTLLYLPSDHFAQWELRGAFLYNSGGIYVPVFLKKRAEKSGTKVVDVDNYSSRILNGVRWIVSSDTHFASAMPSNFRLYRREGPFLLYRRVGPTPPRGVVETGDLPYAPLDCSTPTGRALVAKYRRAAVVPAPVIQTNWKGSIAKPGGTATMRVRLPAGRWDVSVQYVSTTGAKLTGPGLNHSLQAWLGRISPYWNGGVLTSDGGVSTLKMTNNQRSWFGRLIGARPLRAQASPGNLPLWHVAFTRHGAPPKVVAANAACGRWVDYLSDPR